MRGSGRRSGRASVLCLATLVAASPLFATDAEEASLPEPVRFAERSSELGIDFRFCFPSRFRIGNVNSAGNLHSHFECHLLRP